MVDLFAGISVRDFAGAKAWYEKLLGAPPAFFPNDVEAVWEVGEHQYLYVQDRPDHAGHALTTLIVDDLEERLAGMAERGLHPATDETYDNGTRKVTFLDPEGNETGFGAVPT
jgi:catechol 2,3-dioxygenase-like lactoylglutathione lyase family enzyme